MAANVLPSAPDFASLSAWAGRVIRADASQVAAWRLPGAQKTALVGTWFSSSTAIQTWDEDEAMEGVALAELADVLQRIKHLDPHAYGEAGDHETHFWPAVLDRWLY